MKIVFWLSFAALAWAYLGYPLAMLARARFFRLRPRRTAPPLPSVTVVLAVRNGAEDLEARVENLLGQDYPPDRLDVVIASNGCTDGTERIASDLALRSPRVSALTSPAEEGKAGALNRGVASATGEVLVFADARQRFHPRAVRRLARAFRDPAAGGVTGRLIIGEARHSAVAGVGRYWQLETQLRLAESRTGSVVGATGAVYAVRRDLFQPLPAGVILDDVWLPLAIVKSGYRIDMAPAAIAYDRPSADYGGEYRRRVRTLVGNYELLRLMPWLLSPIDNPIFVRYVSHKLLRLLTPVLCIALTLSGLLVPGVAYRLVGIGMLAAYGLGALGLVLHLRVLALPSAFLLLHTAGISALLRPARRSATLWAR